MKKIYLLLFMGFSVLSFNTTMQAQSMAQEIEASEDESMTIRSVGSRPQASIIAGTQELTISLIQSSTLYNVEILDEAGMVVYYGVLVANGQAHVYNLPGLSEGYYTMKISNAKNSYSGTFWL